MFVHHHRSSDHSSPSCAVHILDGGLGTTLEDVFHKDISGPLWSASLIKDDPETIMQTHLAFLRAGARLISTSTYQASFSSYGQSGYTMPEATELMHKSVSLAVQARAQHIKGQSKRGVVIPSDIKIVLSLGPFGASLSPAQEFSGFYPPPYGPKAYVVSSQPSNPDTNTNMFDDDGDRKEKEEASILALEVFHYERLSVFASHPSWNEIDAIAFETVPLIREIRAIRRAVGRLSRDMVEHTRDGNPVTAGEESHSKMIPWWISTVWPSGSFPEQAQQTPAGICLSYTPSTVLHALLSDSSPTYPRPTAIGVNCTSITHLSHVVEQFRESIISDDHKGKLSISEPLSLVLYPNAGYTYDPHSKTWNLPSTEEQHQRSVSDWAHAISDIVRRERSSGVWGGSVVVGGCCKAGPEHISALVKLAGEEARNA